jgi:hypothetical protein
MGHMLHVIACQALRSGKCLSVEYHGFARVVEVHVVGKTRDGDWTMRAWQTSGGSQSNEPVGWKMMKLDEVTSPKITAKRSQAPRPDYNPDDPAIVDAVCKV